MLRDDNLFISQNGYGLYIRGRWHLDVYPAGSLECGLGGGVFRFICEGDYPAGRLRYSWDGGGSVVEGSGYLECSLGPVVGGGSSLYREAYTFSVWLDGVSGYRYSFTIVQQEYLEWVSIAPSSYVFASSGGSSEFVLSSNISVGLLSCRWYGSVPSGYSMSIDGGILTVSCGVNAGSLLSGFGVEVYLDGPAGGGVYGRLSLSQLGGVSEFRFGSDSYSLPVGGGTLWVSFVTDADLPTLSAGLRYMLDGVSIESGVSLDFDSGTGRLGVSCGSWVSDLSFGVVAELDGIASRAVFSQVVSLSLGVDSLSLGVSGGTGSVGVLSNWSWEVSVDSD